MGTSTKTVDLVIQGGGVKGVAALGVILTLAEAGYRFNRIAGTSAGAIVGTLVAAYQRAGEDLHKLEPVMRELDYNRFKDPSTLERFTGPIGLGIDLLVKDGLYSGDFVQEFMTPLLEGVGVTTFDDLRLDDPDAAMPDYQAYSLVIAATDISRRVLVRLPWDYGQYGRQPGEQRIVDAVRASMSFPFFFRPVQFTTGAGEQVTWVDGGMVANFPVTIFDRTDDKPPRWPTWAVMISAEPVAADKPVTSALGQAHALYDTVLSAMTNRYHLAEEGLTRRTITVDTSEVTPLDFGLTRDQQQTLFAHGRAAGQAFLARQPSP
ncbi:patatin-like phospholipase family protein [Kutzneria buriramensis]|uniref:NTE family protein n=1 Tax=Kutzneria buriramensis TaxID=1045776 RepID=A0A3E0GY74_9PSEU|nr:patatin-like phospholipase family protein [Kutzneria buriramensis]REH33059.1 NTE family protein [Kutzneria buriramensis]